MGNQTSAQRQAGASGSSSSAASAQASATGSDPPTRSHSRRDSKHPIPVQIQRAAAPPEQSPAQAQGSTTVPPRSQQYPLSIPSPSSSVSRSAELPSRPLQTGPADGPSKPVAVPNASQAQQNHQPHKAHIPGESAPGGGAGSEALETPEAAMVPTSSMSDLSYITRPPRLPLPIEEEIHTPGSPIISPNENVPSSPTGAVETLDSEETLNRKSSALSSGTYNHEAEEEEEGGDELSVDKTRPTVPFRLEWPHGGEKVYVTGTIFQWNRKHRLHPVEGKPGHFAATINILPGTHHVRFLVDGQMQTSTELPVTVDFGNNLVNYIEVSVTEPTPPGIVQPDAPEKKVSQQELAGSRGPSQIDEKTVRYKEVDPKEVFEHEIPTYLVDFDQPEDSHAYHVSVGAIEKLPAAPALPGFLSKPILNAAVLIKDDNSVLNMPNHTVLNHLATSSIKNNILAVSATTRYKSKVCWPSVLVSVVHLLT